MLSMLQNQLLFAMQIDYEFDSRSSTWNALHDEKHLNSNLSILLEWSPFATEAELLKQVRTTSRELMQYRFFVLTFMSRSVFF